MDLQYPYIRIRAVLQVAAGTPTACDAVCALVMPILLRGRAAGEGPHEGLALAGIHSLIEGVKVGLPDMKEEAKQGWCPFKVSGVQSPVQYFKNVVHTTIHFHCVVLSNTADPSICALSTRCPLSQVQTLL